MLLDLIDGIDLIDVVDLIEVVDAWQCWASAVQGLEYRYRFERSLRSFLLETNSGKLAQGRRWQRIKKYDPQEFFSRIESRKQSFPGRLGTEAIAFAPKQGEAHHSDYSCLARILEVR